MHLKYRGVFYRCQLYPRLSQKHGNVLSAIALNYRGTWYLLDRSVNKHHFGS